MPQFFLDHTKTQSIVDANPFSCVQYITYLENASLKMFTFIKAVSNNTVFNMINAFIVHYDKNNTRKILVPRSRNMYDVSGLYIPFTTDTSNRKLCKKCSYVRYYLIDIE